MSLDTTSLAAQIHDEAVEQIMELARVSLADHAIRNGVPRDTFIVLYRISGATSLTTGGSEVVDLSRLSVTGLITADGSHVEGFDPNEDLGFMLFLLATVEKTEDTGLRNPVRETAFDMFSDATPERYRDLPSEVIVSVNALLSYVETKYV